MLDIILSWEGAFLFLSTLLAFFIKAITGFGNTLVMGSLFSFVVPNTVTTPVDLLMSVPTNGYMAWHERNSITFKRALPLAILMVIGLIPGTFFLKMGPDWLLRAILGLVIVGMALQIAHKKTDSQVKKNNRVILALTGLVSGILTGIFGIGALVAVYFSKTTDNKQQFRSNTCFVFLFENVFRVLLYWATGIFNRQIFLITIALLPAVVIGMALGRKADKYIDEVKMKHAVVALLLLSGTMLVIRNVFFR
ncbi:MAG: sulfite exporter TauE/SafE family protein [Oscillospiraceae bacterium]|nr:sulfite exporter TauE/SafE family protein [Oscillospiraceae bacterium]